MCGGVCIDVGDGYGVFVHVDLSCVLIMCVSMYVCTVFWSVMTNE